MRFRPRQRLRRPADFAAVRTQGRRQFGAAFLFSTLQRPSGPGRDLPRLGIVAPRRIGNAVMRNLLKRRLREIFRRHQAIFPAGTDVVVVLQPKAAAVDYARLERDFLNAARRSGFEPGTGATVSAPHAPSSQSAEVPDGDVPPGSATGESPLA